MISWSLPTSLNIGGKEYKIRSDYRAVLDILTAMNDPEIFEPGMSEKEKNIERVMTMLQILYEDFESIPSNQWNEATKKAKEFIDCGMSDDGKPKPRLMDWEQDAPLIIPAVNKVCHQDIRSLKYMHWWTFISLYMEIGDSMLSTVISIRKKRKKGQKLEKWEKEFYQNNKSIVDLKVKCEERSDEEKEALRKLFGIVK